MTESRAPSASSFEQDLARFAALMEAEGLASSAPEVRPRRPASYVAPMSFAQELIWLLDRATPGLTAYNLPVARRISGPLDRAAIERALNAVAARHDALRTRLLEVEGEPRQVIDAATGVDLRVVDLQQVPESERESRAQDVVRDRARTPFDLAHERLFRATLVVLAPTEHVLVLELHHAVVDGWSLGIIFRELSVAYAAAVGMAEAELPDVPMQLADFAEEQRARLSGARLQALLDFWRAHLDSADQSLGLPTDFHRPSTASFAGARESLLIDADLFAGIRELARCHNASVYMVLLAAYGVVLHRYAGRDDVLIGSGSAGRTSADLERLVGYVNNTVVQRVDLRGDPTFTELLERVRDGALDVYEHQEMPLEKLVLELRRDREPTHQTALFDVVLTMQDVLQGTFTLDGLAVTSFGADLGATKFDITLLASERGAGLTLTSQYRSELFAPETMRAFLGHIATVLRAMVEAPRARVAEVSLLTGGEVDQLGVWRATDVDEGAAATLVELIEAQAARVASRDAVTGIGLDGAPAVALTYRELNARGNQLAQHLRALGVRRGAAVGLLADRSADAIVGLLGILKAGAAYVPLAPDAPPTRLARQVEESGAQVVVTVEPNRALLPGALRIVALDSDAELLSSLPTDNVASEAQPDDVAYVLYTSGSTGTPKGVSVTHANAVHYARAISRVLADVPSATAGDGFRSLDGWRFTVASSLTTDLGNTSLLPALLSGATVDVLPPAVATSAAHFASYVARCKPDVMKMTPSHARALIGDAANDATAPIPERWLVLGGEALPWDLATRLGSARCRILNHYGPTETTVGVATYEVRGSVRADARTVPIGFALANTRLYVVDAAGNEQPVGIPGELIIGGGGVARGYLNDETLTESRFIREPISSASYARAYRTGDRVRRLRDGALEFLGRLDDQVKVHGFRVEPADVESAIRRHAGVAECAVVARATEIGDSELLAFVVAAPARYGTSGHVATEELRAWTQGELPAHMVPSGFAVLNEIPRTPSGKIDRRALMAYAADRVGQEAYVAPSSEAEIRIAAIWADVLKRERVGATDDFMSLGGHSLLAIRVLGKLSREFGVRLPLRALFEAPTVRQLAEVVELERQLAALESMPEDEAARLLASQGGGERQG